MASEIEGWGQGDRFQLALNSHPAGMKARPRRGPAAHRATGYLGAGDSGVTGPHPPTQSLVQILRLCARSVSWKRVEGTAKAGSGG